MRWRNDSGSVERSTLLSALPQYHRCAFLRRRLPHLFS
jgi:hypothetical protein